VRSALPGLVAAVSAVALLVGVPVGLAIGIALAGGAPIAGSVATVSLRLELLTACTWAALFLLLDRLSSKYPLIRSAPLSAIVLLLAFTVGILAFYRTEPGPTRVLLSFQYAVLVVLALWLFGFLASWLATQADPQHRRRAA
jgi:hypothetical protein